MSDFEAIWWLICIVWLTLLWCLLHIAKGLKKLIEGGRDE